MGDHFKTLLLIVSAALPLILAGCSYEPFANKVPLSKPLDAPEDARPSPVSFNKIRFAIRTGAPVVVSRPRGFGGVISCQPPYGIAQVGAREKGFPTDNYREIFYDTLEAQGYDVAGNPGRLFDEDEDLMRGIYSVGGNITDLKIDVCRRRKKKTDYLINSDYVQQIGEEGEASIAVEWTIFDLLSRRNVYKVTTGGYAMLKIPNQEGVQLLLEESLAAATHNLGADPQFHDLIFYGVKPEKKTDTVADPEENPVMMFDPQEDVRLPGKEISAESAKDRLEDIVKTAVLIQVGHGHGSGFFITEQGHILTNAHVIGNATRARVVTSGKQEKLVAEVMRVDRKRDIALLRLEKIPPDLKISTLPVRTEAPKIGEDVYAIGAPRRTQLQDTITKGIVSAHRIERRTKLPFIQADVDIYGGNSGGPLIDGHGNIIGVSVLGFLIDSEEAMGGLNWFIPISDGLETLNIRTGE